MKADPRSKRMPSYRALPGTLLDIDHKLLCQESQSHGLKYINIRNNHPTAFEQFH